MTLLFEPWEIEEIICIFAFVTNQYDQIFNHLGWKVQEGYESLDWEPSDDFAIILQDQFDRSSYLNGTASHGLEMLHNILFKPRTPTQLVSILQENLREVGSLQFFEDTEGFPGWVTQISLRTSYQSDRDLKMQLAEPLPFDGDSEPRLGEKKQGPPLAWTLIWQGTYCNLYGYIIPNDMRLWAYIMWDAERLEYTDAKDVLIRQFTTEHPRDPRIGLQYWSGHGPARQTVFS